MTSDTQTPQDSQGLNHQPRGIHDSSQKCGRGRPCWVTVGGVVLGQVKAQQRPQQRETEWGKVGVCWVEGHIHGGGGRGGVGGSLGRDKSGKVLPLAM